MYLKSQLQLINQDKIQTPARIYIDRELGDRLDHSLPTLSGEEQFAALPPGAQTAAGSSRSSPRRRGSAVPREQALSSSSIDSRQKHTSATPPSVDALEFNCVVATEDFLDLGSCCQFPELGAATSSRSLAPAACTPPVCGNAATNPSSERNSSQTGNLY